MHQKNLRRFMTDLANYCTVLRDFTVGEEFKGFTLNGCVFRN